MVSQNQGMNVNDKQVVEVVSYANCFVCGAENAHGLQLKFFWDGAVCRTSFVATEQFCGYHQLLHGGILGTIFDEVMIKAILAQDVVAVTGELTTKYLQPVKTGETINFEARVLKHRGRLFLTEGVARKGSGELVASASAKYIEVADGALKSQLLASLDDSNR